MVEFAEFLKESSNKELSGRKLFQPGRYDVLSEPSWTDWTNPRPVMSTEIEKVQSSLAYTFPASYHMFMETLGPGSWADALFAAPTDLYAFDEDVGEMCGFIPLAFNVNGCGDSVAVNPREPGAIFFCSHDPFGYAIAASSFEQFMREIAQYKLDHEDTYEFYSALSPFTDVEPPPLKKPAKAWWEFWK